MSAPSLDPSRATADATQPPARLIVLGAGALGTLFGARLSQTLPVILVARARQVEAIQSNGVMIVSYPPEGTVEKTVIQSPTLQAATVLPPLETHDSIALFCKTPDTAEAARQIAAACLQAPQHAATLTVWTFQNGIDNRAVLETTFANRLPAHLRPPVQVAVAIYGATLEAPGRVADYRGFYMLPETPAGHALAPLLKAAGIFAQISAEIPVELWRKLALNCVVNPLTLLLHHRNRYILTPELAPLRAQVIAEVAAVGRAEGVILDPADLTQRMEIAMAVSQNYSSMYQDWLRFQQRKETWVAAGKSGPAPHLATEIEALNGMVLRLAQKHHIPVPATETLYALVKFHEATA